MRAISLVQKLEFEFTGNVARNALTLGDIDNDGCNELIVGNQHGDVSIFKGNEKIQTISKSKSVTCLAVGDIMNQKINVLIVITIDGCCYIYTNMETILQHPFSKDIDEGVEEVDGQIQSSSRRGSRETVPSTYVALGPTKNKKNDNEKVHLVCIHEQKIPPNAKDIIIGDIDGDGNMEMVIGLTDRVVCSYKWVGNPNKTSFNVSEHLNPSDKILGKFVALNKWECANQIGSLTIHHTADGKPSILIAQPGGTFMRIKCQVDDVVNEECIENSEQSSTCSSVGENVTGSIDYQFLGISGMRNQNVSTEILGDLRCSQYDSGVNFDSTSCDNEKEGSSAVAKSKPYALATLDGTIMLVQDEVILWAMAVDRQIFALTKLDVTGNGFDDIIACSWDGETYMLDQDKNMVRFHLDEPVQAFCSGYYNVKSRSPDVTSLVYITFNTVIIYYDIPLKEFTCKNFEPDVVKLSELFIGKERSPEEALEYVKKMDKKTKRDLIRNLFYNVY